MASARLDDRALIRVTGPDAENFLQNIVTVDLDALEPGTLKPGALLTPQGKILFDFLVAREGADGFLLDCRAAVAADFTRRLLLYKLRAKADIVENQIVATVSWDDESASDEAPPDSEGWLIDTRFPVAVRRRYGESDASPNLSAWRKLRIAHGIAESGTDFDLGDAFPHDVLLDQNGGVGFRKGCYVGQEVVSRMQHRGTARRRVLVAHGDSALPPRGTPVMAGHRRIGELGTVDGEDGLALVRIDRVKEAMDADTRVVAGESELTLAIPAWAQFTFPADSAPDEA